MSFCGKWPNMICNERVVCVKCRLHKRVNIVLYFLDHKMCQDFRRHIKRHLKLKFTNTDSTKIFSIINSITDPTFFQKLTYCLMSQQYDWCHIATTLLLASKMIIFIGTEILSFVLSVIKFFTCASWSGHFLTCLWEECICFSGFCNSTLALSIHISFCQCNICDLTWNLILDLHYTQSSSIYYTFC